MIFVKQRKNQLILHISPNWLIGKIQMRIKMAKNKLKRVQTEGRNLMDEHNQEMEKLF